MIRYCWLLLAALAAALSCAKERAHRDERAAAQVAACAQALEDAVPERGRARLDTLLAGCVQVCPQLPRDLPIARSNRQQSATVVEHCDGFCTDAARQAFAQAPAGREYAALVAACGPEAYGLNADSAPLLSDSWLLLVRTYEWLQSHRAHADKAVQEQLARAGMHAHFAVPLPTRLPGAYTLADSRASRVATQAFYAIVGRGTPPRLRAAAVPVARLRPTGLEFRPLPGGYFPGKLLERPAPDYRARVEMLQAMHPGEEHSIIDATPLMLIDGDAPLTTLMSAMRSLERPRAVLGVADHVARAHPIAIERLTRTSSAAPILAVRQGGFILRGAKDQEFPEAARERLQAALDELSISFSPADEIEVVLPAQATVQDLVALMDLVAHSRFAAVLLRDVAPAATPATPP